jgi:hypothetical protein
MIVRRPCGASIYYASLIVLPYWCVFLCVQGYGLQRIKTTSSLFDPLHFPLLHPNGEPGWRPCIPHKPTSIDQYEHTPNKKVSLREWAAYWMQVIPRSYTTLSSALGFFFTWYMAYIHFICTGSTAVRVKLPLHLGWETNARAYL